MRLLDRMRRILPPSSALRPTLDAATCVVVDNVAHYYGEHYYDKFHEGKDTWNIVREFPNLAPPWDIAFFEARSPQWFGQGELEHLREIEQIGALVWAEPMQKAAERVQRAAAQDDEQYTETYQRAMRVFFERAKWLVTICPLIYLRGYPPELVYSDSFGVSSEGLYVEPLPGAHCLRGCLNPRFDKAEADDAARALSPIINIVFLTFCFAHCKNVTLSTVTPDRKLAKRTRERHGIDPCSYSVIEIEPMKRVLQTEGRSGELGAQKALHICRGHFKTYRERGLFGKYPGTFFVPMHVRGAAEHGTVVSTYDVKSPEHVRQ